MARYTRQRQPHTKQSKAKQPKTTYPKRVSNKAKKSDDKRKIVPKMQ